MDGLDGELARALDNLDSGEVRVASGNAGALHVLPRALKRLREDHPGIRVRLIHCVLAEGLDLLLTENVELVFGIEGPVSTASEFHPLQSYELVLIVPPDHPLAGRDSVTPEEIAACPAVVPQFGTYGLHSGDSPLRQLGIEPNSVIEAGGWDLVEEYVEAGLGVAICPSLCITDASRVAVVPLRQYFGKRSYGWFMQLEKPLSWPAQPLFPEPPTKWLLLREDPSEQRQDVAFPFLLDGAPFIPAARPEVASGGEAQISLVGSNLAAGAVSVRAQVFGANGEAIDGGGEVVLEANQASGGELSRLNGKFVAGKKLEPGRLHADRHRDRLGERPALVVNADPGAVERPRVRAEAGCRCAGLPAGSGWRLLRTAERFQVTHRRRSLP